MNAIQRVYTGTAATPVTPISGTFTLTLDGQTTGSLDYDASAATVQAALESLSSVGPGNASVAPITGGYQVEFVGAMANTDVALMTTTPSLAQAVADPSVSNTQNGATDQNNSTSISESFTDGDMSNPAVLTLTFSPVPNSGSWSISGVNPSYFDTPSVTNWNASGTAQSGTVVLTNQSVGGIGSHGLSYMANSLAFVSTGQPEIYTVTIPADATNGKASLILGGASAAPTFDGSDLATALTGTGWAGSAASNVWTLTTDTNREGTVTAGSDGGDPLRKACGMEVVETQTGGP